MINKEFIFISPSSSSYYYYYYYYYGFVPLQVYPSPLNPTLHTHLYEPTVFRHSALTPQV